MKTIAIVAWAALTASAAGQVITTPGLTANLSMSWMEDPVGPTNGNGLLDVGERALFLTSLSFTGQFTQASFSPPLGQFSSGMILGLAFAHFDIVCTTSGPQGLYNNGITVPTSTSVGPNSNAAGTSGYGVRGGWRLGGNVANGIPAFNGFTDIVAAQLTPDPALVNTANPISNLDRIGWAPASYQPRNITFAVRPSAQAGSNALGLIMDLDGGMTVGVAYLPMSSITYGSVTIPIPGPGGMPVLGLGALLAGRRRRAGTGGMGAVA